MPERACDGQRAGGSERAADDLTRAIPHPRPIDRVRVRHAPAVGDAVAVRPEVLPDRAVEPPGQESKRFTVLHVVRNMGGGLASAIMDYVAAVPEARHVVLCDLETSFQVSDVFPFAVIRRMPRSFRGAIDAIRRSVGEHRPDVVHAHSSFAGLYARAGLGGDALRRVIYTPHGYAFFRSDVPPPARALFWLTEALLTVRAPAVAACSPQEVRAAQRMPRARAAYVPNVAGTRDSISLASPPVEVPRHRRQLVVTVGRMCAQKDPMLFLEAALAARARGLDYDWLWIGGGDQSDEAEFDRHGVPYTGWLPRTAVLRLLADADVYVHCAAWEGAPISILEAGELGVPVLGRRTAALASLGLDPLWSDVGELIAMLAQGMQGPAVSRARDGLARLMQAHTPRAQRDALLAAYAGVMDRAGAARAARFGWRR